MDKKQIPENYKIPDSPEGKSAPPSRQIRHKTRPMQWQAPPPAVSKSIPEPRPGTDYPENQETNLIDRNAPHCMDDQEEQETKIISIVGAQPSPHPEPSPYPEPSQHPEPSPYSSQTRVVVKLDEKDTTLLNKKQNRPWRLLAIIALPLLVLSTSLNFYLWSALCYSKTREAKTLPPGRATPPANKPATSEPVASAAATPEPPRPTAPEPPEPVETAPEPATEPGILSVTQRSWDTKRIRVTVNNRLRGKTPLKLELEPGKYDIVFSRKGNRSFRKVVIKPGQTTTMVARVPI